MARRRRYKPIVRARRFLLLALLLSAGGFAGYLLSGRLQSVMPAPTPTSTTPLEDAADLVTFAEDFDYEVSEGDSNVFRVKAEQLVSDKEDRMILDQVTLFVEQDDGEEIVVRGDKGTLHLDSNSATLEGGVVARDAEGLEIRGEGFEVVKEGKLLVSTTPVSFGLERQYEGRADELTYHFKKKRLSLEGDVHIETLPADDPAAATIEAQKIIYEKVDGLLRLEGSVRLSRGEEFLEAGRLSITFGEDEKDIDFVRAEQGVFGRYQPPAAGDVLASTVEVRGRLLYALFEPGTREPRQAELHGRSKRPASIMVIDKTGLSRNLSAPVLTADFVGGEVRHAETTGSLTMIEAPAFAPRHVLRRICAESGTAEFDELGELTTLVLDGTVDYQAPGMQALGDRVVSDGAAGKVDIVGKPATVLTDRGDIQSPSITYWDNGEVVARDGVIAELTEPGRYSLMGGEEKEPLRITSREARWSEEEERVIFDGDVRAWQGEDYLLAERLVGEPEEEKLVATGKVKTVLRPKSGDDVLPVGNDDKRSEPVEVTADRLIYVKPERTITYEGQARVYQTGRRLSCDELDVELDQSDQFERMICTGDLLVEDPEKGNKVTGDRAVYEPDSAEVEITGDPVILTEREGAEIRGGRVIYSFASGAAEILSRPRRVEEAAQTTEIAEGGP